ncbi:MAG TPA: ATP phosphoribosyltransferase regulatory subunit [Candidatus Nanoarchaeia archaeon]|nr:ATP phosphoribosyltransferase regulatory subunit [Candidatus Nanoarchaeia archaeon]
MKTENVKGFKDYVGEEAEKRAELKKIIINSLERYGFKPVETPIIEYEEFVKGGNERDEAVSDIFKLKDKGKRELALRYEFTFQLKRIAKNQKLPFKRYQIGEVFRDEPVSSNRFRQFVQCDADIVGSSVKDEAEILALANEVLKKAGINPIILINNRKLLNEILDSEGIKEKDKESVLKEIDKYDKLPEKDVRNNLKKYKAENVISLLKKGEKFFSQFESYKEIISLMEYCKIYGLKAIFSPSIVRGLSYYNGSVFEIRAGGIKETIVAGGSYKIENLQSTGISFGLERISSITKIDDKKEGYLIISLEQDRKAIEIAQILREKGEIVTLFYGKPSKALEYANSYKINKVIFVGEREVKKKEFKVKNMKTGKEKILKI